MKNIFCAAVGLENAKDSLREIIVLPALKPEVSVMLKRYMILNIHTIVFCGFDSTSKGTTIIWTSWKW